MRFECVGRLGGVKSIAREDKSIVELVMDTEKTRYAIILETPGLTGEHPAIRRTWKRVVLITRVKPENTFLMQ